MKTFINSVSDNAQEKNIDHQISLVKFAGAKNSNIGNDFETHGGLFGEYIDSNYTQIVKSLTNVNSDSGASTLSQAVDELYPIGATQADFGMEKAVEALQSARPNAKKVVVMFTDGDPTSSNGFEESVADSAISQAKSLKDANTTIYTVGIFNGADPDDTADEDNNSNRYMNAVSSNYPDAGSYWGSLGNRVSEDEDYYFAADSASSLTNVFEGIAEDVTTGDLEVNPDETATLEDTLSQYFDLPANIDEDQVEVKYAPATDYDPEKGFTFGELEAVPTEGNNIQKEINEENENIKVTGFNYKKYAASYEKQDDGTYKVSGGKLVVTFEIEVDENACLLDPVENGQYPTNDTKDSKAKLTYKVSDKPHAKTTTTVLNESPKVYFDNTKFDANGTDVTVQVYLDGEKVDPDQYVTLTRKTGANDNWTYFNRVDKTDNVLTYDFNYNTDPESGFNCVDINVALNDDYINDVVLQGVHSYQSHGKGGTNNVSPESNGTYTVDNIASDEKADTVDCTIYLRTKYSAEYYLDGNKQTGNLTDNTVYIEKYDVTESTGEAGYPENRGDAAWMDWKNGNQATSITVKPLPEGNVSGWTLKNASYDPTDIVSVAENKGKAEDNVFKFNATTVQQYKITINYVDESNQPIKNAYTETQNEGYGYSFDVNNEAGTKIPFTIEKDEDSQYVFDHFAQGSDPLSGTLSKETGNVEITAVYALDSDKDGTPDKYEATVTYKVENGTWTDKGSSDPIEEEFVIKEFDPDKNSWVNKEATLGDTIPEATANAGYDQNTGAWDADINENTKVTKDVTYTYTFDNQKYAVTIQYQNEDGDTIKTAFTDDPANVNTDYAYVVSDDERGDIPFIIKDGDTQYVYDRLAKDSAALSGKLDGNKTITAIYAVDENGNNIPDKYEVTVTYKIVNGTWSDDTNTDKTADFVIKEFKDGQWIDKEQTLGDTIPQGMKANAGYDPESGKWDADIKADTKVTEDVTYTHTFAEEYYTLTYHSTSGYFGSADQTEAVVSDLLAKDYDLWTKVSDTEYTGTVPTDTTWPTHAQAEAPKGSVIVDEGQMVDVEFIGWTTVAPEDWETSRDVENKADYIYTAGEEYPTISSSVTIPPSETEKDEDVYAVWGYDENDDGIADAQQIVIVPADITIYQGGNGYDGVLTDLDDGIADGDNEQATTNDNGLPEPGYYFILPYELNDYLGGADKVIDLSGKLQLDFVNKENPNDERGWTLELYNKDASPEDNKAYGKYVYRLVPQHDIPVRLEINAPLLDENGNKQYDDEGNVIMHLVSSDDFTVRLNSLFQEFSMKLWTDPEVDRTQVTAQVQDKDNNNAWTDANKVLEGENSVQGIARGTAKLTVRGTTNEEAVTPVQDAAPETITGITAVGNEKNEYVTNESNIPVVPNEDENNVALLADSIVSESETAQALKSAVTDNEAHGISSDYTFDFSYLDLVDTNNGNAYLTLAEEGMSVDLYWPKPADMDENAEVYIVHYDGLDREFDASNLDANYVTDNADIKVYSTDAAEDSGLKLERTDDWIKITTSTFSPFALVYKQKDEPSVTPDPGPGGSGDDERPGLNLEDHYSYIVGYPEDYRTGEATDDESLWPVKPQGKITRAEVATIFYRLLNDETRTENWTTDNDFTDVSEDNWFNTPVSTLSNMGIIVGYNDGSFQPNAPITRAEFAAIAVRFYQNNDVNYEEGLFTDIEGSEWFADAIAAAYEHGIIGGYVDGSFQPMNQITRAEAAAIVNRTTDRFPDKDHLLDEAEMRTWPDNANPDAWYYADIQEATNSHEYYKMDDPDGEEGDQIEQWTERGEDVDWDAVEAYQESVH